MLLQATIDGMSDVTFTLKDVIYILTIALTIAGMIFNIRSNNKAVNIRLKNAELKQKESELIIHKRIEKTQNDMKEYITKSDQEFKEINKNLNVILGYVKK